MISVGETHTTSVAATPPIVTTGEFGNLVSLVPLIRIAVPPVDGPETGRTPEIDQKKLAVLATRNPWP